MRVIKKLSKKLLIVFLSLAAALSAFAGFMPQAKTTLALNADTLFTASGGASIAAGGGEKRLDSGVADITYKQTVTGSTAQGVLIEGARGANAEYSKLVDLTGSGLNTPLIEIIYPVADAGAIIPTVYVSLTSAVNPTKNITIGLFPREDMVAAPLNVKASSMPLSQVSYYNMLGLGVNPGQAATVGKLTHTKDAAQTPTTATGTVYSLGTPHLEDGTEGSGNIPLKLYYENKNSTRGNAGIYFGGYLEARDGAINIGTALAPDWRQPVRIMSDDSPAKASNGNWAYGPTVDFTGEEAKNIILSVTIAETNKRLDNASSPYLAKASDSEKSAILVKSVLGTDLGEAAGVFKSSEFIGNGVEVTSGEGGKTELNAPMYLSDNDLLTPFADIYIKPSQARDRADRYDLADTTPWNNYKPDFKKLVIKLQGGQNSVEITALEDTSANRYRTLLSSSVNGAAATTHISPLSFDGENRYTTHFNGNGTVLGAMLHDSIRLYYDAATKAIYTDFGNSANTAIKLTVGNQTFYRWKLCEVDLSPQLKAYEDMSVLGVDMSIETGDVVAGRTARFVIGCVDNQSLQKNGGQLTPVSSEYFVKTKDLALPYNIDPIYAHSILEGGFVVLAGMNDIFIQVLDAGGNEVAVNGLNGGKWMQDAYFMEADGDYTINYYTDKSQPPIFTLRRKLSARTQIVFASGISQNMLLDERAGGFKPVASDIVIYDFILGMIENAQVDITVSFNGGAAQPAEATLSSIGKYEIVYELEYTAGGALQKSSFKRNVEIADRSIPELTVSGTPAGAKADNKSPQPSTVFLKAVTGTQIDYSAVTPTARDINAAGGYDDLSGRITVTSIQPGGVATDMTEAFALASRKLSVPAAGVYTLVFSVEDKAGLVNLQKHVIDVRKHWAVFEFGGGFGSQFDSGERIVFPSASITSYSGASLNAEISVKVWFYDDVYDYNGSFTTQNTGDYRVVYTASYDGESISYEHAFSVTDKTKPTITLLKKMAKHAKVGGTVHLPNAKITDNLDKNIDYVVEVYFKGERVEYQNNYFIAENKGVYTIVYKAVDGSGNTAETSFKVRAGTNTTAIVLGLAGGAVAIAGVATAVIVLKKKKI